MQNKNYGIILNSKVKLNNGGLFATDYNWHSNISNDY